LGGLLIGLCKRYLGDHPKEINEAVSKIRETGRFDYKHLPQEILTAATSLIFGASLVPEAAIMEQLADNGSYAYVDDLDEAQKLFVEDLTSTMEVIALNAKILEDFNPDVVACYRLIALIRFGWIREK
jgi:hypothetical protein